LRVKAHVGHVSKIERRLVMLWLSKLKLRSKDPSKRLQVVNQLAADGSPGAIALIISQLRDHEGWPTTVAGAAAAFLGQLRPPEAVAPLAEEFRKDYLFTEGGEALAQIGSAEAVDVLISIARENDDARNQTLIALRKVDHDSPHIPKIAEAFADALHDHELATQSNAVLGLDSIFRFSTHDFATEFKDKVSKRVEEIQMQPLLPGFPLGRQVCVGTAPLLAALGNKKALLRYMDLREKDNSLGHFQDQASSVLSALAEMDGATNLMNSSDEGRLWDWWRANKQKIVAGGSTFESSEHKQVGRRRPMGGIKALEELIEVCRSHLTAEEDEKYLDKAREDLELQGVSGSDALGEFIQELASCRSDKIGYALCVAEELTPSPKLLTALKALSSTAASNVRTAPPAHQRFQAELVGAGQIAWGTSTATRLGRKAVEVLAKIAPHEVTTMQQDMGLQGQAPIDTAALPSDDRLGTAKDSKTPPETLAALASWATPLAYDNVSDTREAIDVLIAVAENPSTPVKTLELICDRRHIGFWELTHNPNCPSHILKRIAACDNPFTAGCARSHPNFPK